MPRQFGLAGKWRLLQQQGEKIRTAAGNFCGWIASQQGVTSEPDEFSQLVALIFNVRLVVAAFGFQRGKIKIGDGDGVAVVIESDFAVGVHWCGSYFVPASAFAVKRRQISSLIRFSCGVSAPKILGRALRCATGFVTQRGLSWKFTITRNHDRSLAMPGVSILVRFDVCFFGFSFIKFFRRHLGKLLARGMDFLADAFGKFRVASGDNARHVQ